MQGSCVASHKANLTHQIEVYKNYHEHRRRLDLTRYKSPLSLKKSLSFDQTKSLFFHDLRSRKQYTNEFNRRETSRRTEEQDAKMLRKILEYDQKLFVFSLNSDRPSKGFLHHNARVAHSKNHFKIDEENEKIHFRITTAKSLYNKEYLQSSRQSPVARTFLLRKHSSYSKIQPAARSARRLLTENQEEAEQALIKDASQFSNLHRLKEDLLRVETSASRVSESKRFRLNGSPKLFALASNSAVCDRIRKERLASKLYEKKLKLQSTIMSRLSGRR